MGVIIMKRLVISGLILLLVFVVGAPIQARILIPLDDLEISEFNEEIGLIWNGNEEMIIQKVIIETGSSGYILDLMPLPAEPAFNDTWNDNIFSITREAFINRQRGFEHPDYFFESPRDFAEIELIDQELVHGNETELVIEAINDFLTARDFNAIERTDTKTDLIEGYLNRDIEYFHFRLISVPGTLASRIDQWQFNSDTLYYPLDTNLTGNLYFTLIQPSPHLDFYDYQASDFIHYIPPKLTIPDTLKEIEPELTDFFDTILIYTFFWELNL